MIARNEKSIVKLERWYILRVLMLKDFRANCFCASLLCTQIHRLIVDFHRPIVDFQALCEQMAHCICIGDR